MQLINILYITQWAIGVGKGPFEVKVRGTEWDLIPYLGQMELANVPSEGWVIDPDKHGLLDGYCAAVHLPTHDGRGCLLLK